LCKKKTVLAKYGREVFSVYPTPIGERVLLGAERRLYEESLAMLVDGLSMSDADFGVPVFDRLQLGQKVFSLYRAGRVLLDPDEPARERTAFVDAAVATVYRHIHDMVVQEIDEPEFATHHPGWRQMVAEAAAASDNVDEVPEMISDDKVEWDTIVEGLTDDVLPDRDFEIECQLDADPDASRELQETMGISENYHTAVPQDPSGAELNLYLDALKGLTPRGRGEYRADDDAEESGTDFF
jgi:hypothetical protein